MNKPTVFLDFDEVLADSIKAFCEVYNNKYKYNKDFIPADHNKVYLYNFKDQCPLLKCNHDVNSIFDSEMFFELLQPKADCIEILKKYQDFYNYCIVTIGTPKNLSRKVLYIEECFPFIKDIILIHNGNNDINKSKIDMSSKNGIPNIFIDDHEKNLQSSNVEVKLCFSSYGVREWNKSCEFKLKTWLDVRIILEMHKQYYKLEE